MTYLVLPCCVFNLHALGPGSSGTERVQLCGGLLVAGRAALHHDCMQPALWPVVIAHALGEDTAGRLLVCHTGLAADHASSPGLDLEAVGCCAWPAVDGEAGLVAPLDCQGATDT